MSTPRIPTGRPSRADYIASALLVIVAVIAAIAAGLEIGLPLIVAVGIVIALGALDRRDARAWYDLARYLSIGRSDA